MSKIVDVLAPWLAEEKYQDRAVVSTADPLMYFCIKWNTNVPVLMLPSDKAMRMNHQLIDGTIDALAAFKVRDVTVERPDFSKWEGKSDLGLTSAALALIQTVPDKGLLACDIETCNVKWLPSDNTVLIICIAWDGGCIQLTRDPLRSKEVREALQQCFDKPDLVWCWHNGKFDTGRIKSLLGLRARVDEDTMLMHYVGINERRGTHGLKDLGALYLQMPDWDAELEYIKKTYCRAHGLRLDEFDYSMIPMDVLLKYSAFDTIGTLELYKVLKKCMRPESLETYRRLIIASNAYREVEVAGVQVDMDYLEELEYILDREIAVAKSHFDEVIREVWDPYLYQRETGSKSLPKFFNVKSPTQLKWLLSKVTGRHLTTTNKEQLEALFDEFGDELPIIQALRDLRKAVKFLDTYVLGFRNIACADGCIRCTYNLHGTETGRLSSSEPNMQNIPRDAKIKNLFVPREGNVFVQLDYSQAELRVLAWLSQDRFLKNIYLEGADLHDSVATQMFGPDFTKEQRVMAKTINFGVAYGRGASNISKVFKITFADAQKLINNWFKQMPAVEEWIQAQRNGIGRGIEPHTHLGRTRHFVITPENYNHIQNECVNFPIQSIASDLTLVSLCQIHERLRAENLAAHIVITVHDSIVIECQDDTALVRKVIAIGQEVMAQVPKDLLPGLDFPFVSDAEVGYKWGELESVEL